MSLSLWCPAISRHIALGVNDPVDLYAIHFQHQYLVTLHRNVAPHINTAFGMFMNWNDQLTNPNPGTQTLSKKETQFLKCLKKKEKKVPASDSLKSLVTHKTISFINVKLWMTHNFCSLLTHIESKMKCEIVNDPSFLFSLNSYKMNQNLFVLIFIWIN